MQNNEGTIAKYAVDDNLFRLWSTNPKKNSQLLAAFWQFFFFKYVSIFEQIFFTFKSVQILMEDAESAESKEKVKFFRFLFFELWSFLYPNFRWIFHDYLKNKNGKNWKINFSFVSAHCASSIGTGSKQREGEGGRGEVSAYP